MAGKHHLHLACPSALTFCHSDPKLVATPSGIILVALAGKPTGPGFDSKMAKLGNRMGSLMDTVQFTSQECEHRRGNYQAIHTGISYGGGSKVRSPLPTPLKKTKHADNRNAIQAPGELKPKNKSKERVVNKLRSCRELKALSGYVSSEFSQPTRGFLFSAG